MVGIVIQARMNSSRFPGKVLHAIAGKPLLQYLFESLGHCREADMLAVATSDRDTDDPVAAFCREHGVPCHRGSLEDVAGRMLGAAERFGLTAFARVCGDSPLLDHRLADRMLAAFRAGDLDLATNVGMRTFPVGQSVEVLDTAAFAKACRRMRTAAQREHVTRIFYETPGDARIRNIESEGDYGTVRLCVDTREDMARVAAMVRAMRRPHWDYDYRALAALAAAVSEAR
ncbi:MAG: NTP transferase domain-containing protein [Desulfovibrio sp.]